MQLPVLILAGPTASGKTALSLKIAEYLPVEIINADVGQLYVPCTIGTAKPDWKNQSVPHHLFDIIDTPRDINVIEYRSMVIECVQQILARGNIPLIVGGSFFYLYSLFFPPLKIASLDQNESAVEEIKKSFADQSTTHLWNQLNRIDPARAKAIHPHDRYRIVRALIVWETSHVLPSLQTPCYDSPFVSLLSVILPNRLTLYEGINKRTEDMMYAPGSNFITEAEALYDTPWRDFLKKKRLIGYTEIFEWLASHRQQSLPSLTSLIQQATRRYAKRQIVFWHKMHKQLLQAQKKHENHCYIEIVSDNECLPDLAKKMKDFYIPLKGK